MHHSAATVPLAVTAGMLYARAAAASVRPGPRRLLALAPVLALLLALPFSIPLYTARSLAAFSLVWLGEFKLLLLAFGRGPLHPSLRPLPFAFTAALPVKLRQPQKNAAAAVTAETTIALPLLLSTAIKIVVMASAIRLLSRRNQAIVTHPYAAFALFGVAIYCILDSLLPCLAAAGRAALGGVEMEPQFDKPYLSSSLTDFWGRRWNLMASAVLRPAVYDPVRARHGGAAGVLASFLVSGLMHEVVVWYLTFRPPTGHVTAFFALHGACVCAERWWCARRRWGRSAAALPRAVAAPLVVAFVAATAFWLFFPAIFGGGMDDLYLAETASLASSFLDAGGRLVRLLGLGLG
ncbi:unnamed protein product [Urochloa humidicola]